MVVALTVMSPSLVLPKCWILQSKMCASCRCGDVMPAMFFGILGTSGESVYVANNISFESNGGEKAQ